MGKKVHVFPAESIDIEFYDRVFTATFNMRAIGFMQEELGKLQEDAVSIPIERFGAIILYGAIKANTPDYTMEEAVALALTMRPESLQEIIMEYMRSTGMIADEAINEEFAKKIIAQILVKLAKSK